MKNLTKIIFRFIIKNIVPIISIALVLFIYQKLFLNSILTSGDSWYLPDTFIQNYVPNIWYDSYSTGGLYPLTFTQIPFFFFFNILGLSYGLGGKIIFYVPFLVLIFISGYIVPYLISKDKIKSSIILLFLSSNTFILSVIIGSTPLIALSYSLMPIAIFFLHLFFIEKNKNAMIGIIFGIIFGFIVLYDVRYAHLFFIFCIFFYIFNLLYKKINFSPKDILRFSALSAIGLIITNLFWVLPYFFSGNDFISLPQGFDNPNWINVHTVNNISHLFGFKHSYWPNVTYGEKSTTEFYWLFFFLFLICGYLFSSSKKNLNIYLGIFMVSSVLFLGSNFFIKDLNTWIFSNIPSFNIQRDPFKYFVLTTLSIYCFMMALNIKKSWYYYVLGIACIAPVIATINMEHGIFKDKSDIPNDYIKLNRILATDTEINRILWLPYKHRYGEFNTDKAAMQYIDFQSYGFLNLSKTDENVIYDKKNFQSLLQKFGIKYIIIPYDPLGEWGKVGFNSVEMKQKYISTLKKYDFLNYSKLSPHLHLFTHDNYLPHIGGVSNTFIKHNASSYSIRKPSLRKEKVQFLQSFHPQWKLYLEPYSQINCKNPKIYTNSINQEESEQIEQETEIYIVQPGDDFQKIGEIYGIEAEIIREQNSNWDRTGNGWLEIGQEIEVPLGSEKDSERPEGIFLSASSEGQDGILEGQGGTSQKKEETYKVTECESENKFYVGGELSKLWEKPIFDNTHTMVYDYANQWSLDADYIKKNYPKEYYKENPDGSIDVKMTLYFKPQSYFYLGLIISGTTFILIILFLVYSIIKNNNTNKLRLGNKQ